MSIGAISFCVMFWVMFYTFILFGIGMIISFIYMLYRTRIEDKKQNENKNISTKKVDN